VSHPNAVAAAVPPLREERRRAGGIDHNEAAPNVRLLAVSAAADIRVVIVEDDARFAAALTALLESEGLTVVGYGTNGAEGVELARAARPSVVTMDLEMPIMDGVEATKEIPVVIFTTRGSKSLPSRAT
jgi:AmiR/NasT family two-component response regulator